MTPGGIFLCRATGVTEGSPQGAPHCRKSAGELRQWPRSCSYDFGDLTANLLHSCPQPGRGGNRPSNTFFWLSQNSGTHGEDTGWTPGQTACWGAPTKQHRPGSWDNRTEGSAVLRLEPETLLGAGGAICPSLLVTGGGWQQSLTLAFTSTWSSPPRGLLAACVSKLPLSTRTPSSWLWGPRHCSVTSPLITPAATLF